MRLYVFVLFVFVMEECVLLFARVITSWKMKICVTANFKSIDEIIKTNNKNTNLIGLI